MRLGRFNLKSNRFWKMRQWLGEGRNKKVVWSGGVNALRGLRFVLAGS